MQITPSLAKAAGFVLVAALGIAAWQLFGLGAMLMVFAAVALLLGIGLLWNSVQNLSGETPLSFEEALTMGAPSAEEEQKRSVLRALKDLEYELSVGKISAEDHRELSARYRAEAKTLIQSVDEHLGPARERAEKLLQKRLSQAGLHAEAAANAADAEADEESRDSQPPESEPRSEPPGEDDSSQASDLEKEPVEVKS